MSRRRKPATAEERRVRLARDVVEWAIVVALLALLFRPLALVVGVIWAIRLVRRGLRELFSPELRERWVERELARRQATEAPSATRHRDLRAAQSRRVSDLSARVAHELRDPVRAARGLVRQMGEDPGAETNVVHAHAALAELDRVERSISQMLRNARPRAGGSQPEAS
jgi:signal transduction histidine kinase